MKFLTIDFIKQHSRIDFDCEDQLLELYGDAAELTLAQLLNRGKKVDDMITSLTEEYGDIPATLYQAALMLVDESYNHRSATSPTPKIVKPYGFDIIVKPLMILSNG